MLVPAVAERLRERAAQLQKPASRYLAELIEEDIRRSRDEAAAETWPEWEERPVPRIVGT